MTRHRCHPGQELILTLHVSGDFNGEDVTAEIMRVEARHDDPIWKFEVGVRFAEPLSEALLAELERRAAGGGR